MGWWSTGEDGQSFTVDGTGVWGDDCADVMDAALAEIRKQFREVWNCDPTLDELIAGLKFSA